MSQPPETALEIVERALAILQPNERLRALQHMEERALSAADLPSLRVLKRYRMLHYPSAPAGHA